MKELLLQLAKYNIWANKQFADILVKTDEGVLDKEITSSFPSAERCTRCSSIGRCWPARVCSEPAWKWNCTSCQVRASTVSVLPGA